MIKLFQPYVSELAKQNVMRVLSGTQLAQGPEVDLFEEEFASRFGFKKWQVVSVNSGTAALELAYELSDLRPYDHVISPLLTCTATNIPLIRRDVKMTFGDVNGNTHMNLDVDDVKHKVQPDTKAVVFVHFGGSSQGLENLEELCEEESIDLICDAAQALGSKLSKKARFNCISLQAIKSLTAGDGGVLVCRDIEDAKIARRLRWFGYDREMKQFKGDTDLKEAGYKYHMNDISAAIARGNLAEWDLILGHRTIINNIYQEYAGKEGGLIPGIWNPTVVSPGKIGMDYKSMKAKAEAAGFEIGQHHYRNDKYSLFRSVYSNCPNMDDIGDNYFMLPCHMGMSHDDAELIAKTIWPK